MLWALKPLLDLREQLCLLNRCWVIHAQLRQGGLQARPVEAGAGVLLAPGGNMLVAGDVADGVLVRQRLAQLGQGVVLGGLEGLAFQAFQFDADGEVVAIAAPAL